MSTPVLPPAVRRFVAEIGALLGDLSATVGDTEVALEAFNLAASFIDADGRHTDDEVAQLLVASAPWLDHLAGTTAAQARADGLLAGARAWNQRPSTLVEVLAAADRRDGGDRSKRYYERAMDVVHAACAIDDHPSPEELADLDRFRSTVLAAIPTIPIPARPVPGGPVPPRPSPVAGGPAEPAGAGSPPPSPAADPGPPEDLESVLTELDMLVGLEAVKREVRLVAALTRVQQLRAGHGLPVVEGSRHLVFAGNPGTGKTTVARLLSRIYRALGVADKGHLVETDRSGLVAGYVGQTAIRTRDIVLSALGGVLLIDEAHALARGSEQDFGRESIDTLVKLMEDHRDDLVVVAAGYTEEMQHFLDANPGLRSRFPKTIVFADYTDDELVEIVGGLCERNGYRLTQGAADAVRAWLAVQPRGKGFGNARLARNLFEEAVARHASHVVAIERPTPKQLSRINVADIPEVAAT